MKPRLKTITISLLVVLALDMATVPWTAAKSTLPDEAASRTAITPANQFPASYAQALARWRSVDQINQWIGKRFIYDSRRALLLSETQRKKKQNMPIAAPADFYQNPLGVCVDLARFGVETAMHIAPHRKPAYLMIEFQPIIVQGNMLRRHWLAVFQKDRAFYSFADSKRPGHLDGPHASLANLVSAYESFRGREVISYKLLQDYHKKKKNRQKSRMRKRSAM